MTLLVLRSLPPENPLHPPFVVSMSASSLAGDDFDAGVRFYALHSDDGPLIFGGLEEVGADRLPRSGVHRRQGHGHG